MTQAHPRPKIFADANDKTILRIMPRLAVEIGLNESIILLQLSFWIGESNIGQFHDGNWWVYYSTRQMAENYFPYWSASTINRALNNLAEKKLITITDKYNKKAYDKTNWYALNLDELSKLDSIVIVLAQDGKHTVYEPSQNDNLSQNETRSNQNETRSNQNETPIPKTSSKTSSKNSKKPMSPSDEAISLTFWEQLQLAFILSYLELKYPDAVSQAENHLESLEEDSDPIEYDESESPEIPADEPEDKPISRYQRLFNGIALLSFGIDTRDMTDKQRNQLNQDAPRIGKIASWLDKKQDVEPEELWEWGKWYEREFKNKRKSISKPRDLAKFKEFWLQYEQCEEDKASKPKINMLPDYQDPNEPDPNEGDYPSWEEIQAMSKAYRTGDTPEWLKKEPTS